MSKSKTKVYTPGLTVDTTFGVIESSPVVGMGSLMLSSCHALGSQFEANALQNQLNAQMSMATTARSITQIFDNARLQNDALHMKIADLLSEG